MESWSFVSEESVSVDDGTSRGKNGWELNTPCSLRNNYVGIVNQDFSNLGSQLPNNQIRDALSRYKLGGGRGFVSGEKESSSKSSSSVMESNTKDSSLIDLKLGRFAEQNFKSSKIMQDLCFNVSSVPAKRYRGLNSQTSFCQVQGCGKDLSSSKDYHKRHKVCDVHSKTAKVIVKGIEQRFCQQCSRFHLLAEFDDGKRSCRKRLAGHNERRRKPHAGLHSGRTGRLFQSYAGARFQGTSFATTSPFVCQDALGCSLLHQPRLDINGWYKNVKVEPVSDYSSQLTMPFRPLFTSYHAEKHCPAPQGEGMTRNKNNESSNSYVTDMRGSDFVSRSLFHSTSMGSEVLNVMDLPSTFQGISNSGCALSLLSSQSQTGNSSNYSSLVPNAHHLITPSNNAHYHAAQTSEKFPGGIMSSIFNSAEGRLEQILSNSCSINGSIQGSEYVNTKNLFSCEDGPTIDLLQLSSASSSGESKTFHEVKQDGNTFFRLRMT